MNIPAPTISIDLELPDLIIEQDANNDNVYNKINTFFI